MIVSGKDKWTQPSCTHIHSPTDFHVLASPSRNFKAKTQAQLQSDFHPAPGIFFFFGSNFFALSQWQVLGVTCLDQSLKTQLELGMQGWLQRVPLKLCK